MVKQVEGRIRDFAEGRGDLLRIDPRKINVKPNWNSRDFNDPANIEHIESLSLSIAEVGVKEPLRIYLEDGKIWLTNGECRLLATMAAIGRGVDIKTVPAIAEDRYSNEADRVFSQISSNAGKPFSALEQAKVYKKLLDLGWMAKDIAAKAGISNARVSQVLDLLTLPEPIKQMVTNGQVSATMAITAVKEHNPEQAVKVLQDAVVEAQSQGRTKAKPSDAPAEAKPPQNKLKSIIAEAFEYSDVDNNDDEFCIIKMPIEHWEKIKNLLKL